MIRPSPCRYCPYRRDVPSGVWHASEYIKLLEYDRETGLQPTAAFHCHEAKGSLCAGWAQCHGWELLGLRFYATAKPLTVIPEITVPLFASGQEAAQHGLRDIHKPSKAARRAIAYLARKKGLR